MKEKEEVKKTKKTTSKKKEVKEKKETKPKKEVVKKEVKEKKISKASIKEDKKSTKLEEVKEEKKEIVLETKKESSKVLLDTKSQCRLGALSKVISILAKIGKIFLMIAVPFVFILMIAIPFIFKNLEINGNVIKFSDSSITINEDYVTFKAGDKVYISNDDFKELTSIANFFEENTKGDIILLTEVSLGFVGAILIINIYIMSYVEKLFKNFYTQKTPFIEENSNYIYRIGHIMIISAIISIVFEITIGLIFPKIDFINVSSYGIIEILVIFVVYYIFKYAVELQKESKSRIFK